MQKMRGPEGRIGMAGNLEKQRSEADPQLAGENVFRLEKYRIPYPPPAPGTEVAFEAPWHLGGEVLHIGLQLEQEKARQLIPLPLEPGPNLGEAAIWFAEWVSVSEGWPDLAFLFPEKAVYRECMVLVACQYRGVPGFFVPYAWVDGAFDQARGLAQGVPRRADRISLTRLNSLNPKIGGRRAGAKVRGVCDSNGRRLLEGSIVFTGESEPTAVPGFKLFLLNRVQMIEDPGRAAVHELTTGRLSDVRVADVWAGVADVTFLPSPFEDFSRLGPPKVCAGLHFSMGATIAGAEMVYKYV